MTYLALALLLASSACTNPYGHGSHAGCLRLRGGDIATSDVWWERSSSASKSLVALHRLLVQGESAGDQAEREDADEDAVEFAAADCIRKLKLLLEVPQSMTGTELLWYVLCVCSVWCLETPSLLVLGVCGATYILMHPSFSSTPMPRNWQFSACPCAATAAGTDQTRRKAVAAVTRLLEELITGSGRVNKDAQGEGGSLQCRVKDAFGEVEGGELAGGVAADSLVESLGFELIVVLAPLSACRDCGGSVRAIISRVLALEDAACAHRHLNPKPQTPKPKPQP